MSYSIKDPGLTFSGTRTKRSKTEGIIIHHPDAQWTVWQTHDYHKKSKGWLGIGYNFYIHKDGTIYSGRGMEYVGAHATNYNSKTIGISCQGQYHSTDKSMPDAQFNALVWLIKHLKEKYGSGIYVKGHKEVASTSCPGQYFPLAEVKKLAYRSGSEPTPQPEPEKPIKDTEEEEVTPEKFEQMYNDLLNRNDPLYKELTDVPGYMRNDVAELMIMKAIRGDGLVSVGKRKSQLDTMIVMLRYYHDANPRYMTLDDCPEWLRPEVQTLIDAGAIKGDGEHQVNKTHSELISAIIAKRFHEEDVK